MSAGMCHPLLGHWLEKEEEERRKMGRKRVKNTLGEYGKGNEKRIEGKGGGERAAKGKAI